MKRSDSLKQFEEGLLKETYEIERASSSKDVKSFARNVRKYIIRVQIGKPKKLPDSQKI